MEQLALFFGVIGTSGILCSLFGILLLTSPQAIHKLNERITRSILSFDSIFLKYNRYAGISFLVTGAALLYMIIRVQ